MSNADLDQLIELATTDSRGVAEGWVVSGKSVTFAQLAIEVRLQRAAHEGMSAALREGHRSSQWMEEKLLFKLKLAERALERIQGTPTVAEAKRRASEALAKIRGEPE